MSGRPSRLLLVVAALLAVLPALGAGPPQFLASDASHLGVTPGGVAALRAFKAPVLTAKAAALIDATTGAVLYSKNGEQRFAPASLTKMMTALVAIERGRLDQRLTATQQVRSVEPVLIGLDPGEALALGDLLYGLLLWSGNDAAVCIAEGLGGSVGQFVTWMNEEAKALGLRNTHFANPHGLDAPGHYSTAIDLARLAVAMMRQPTLAQIAGTREYTIPGPPLYHFRNSNPLLGVYDGVIGGKTGLTDDCGRCFAVVASRGGHTVAAVVLGSLDIARDGRVLLDYAFSSYEWVPASTLGPGRFGYQRDGQRGEARLDPGAAVAVFPWESRRARVRAVVDGAPAQASQAIGRVVFESAFRVLGSLPLFPASRGP